MTAQKTNPQTRTQIIEDTLQTLYDLVTLKLSTTVTSWIEFELTFAQIKALLVLARHGELILSELAQVLGTGNSATSILVQQLVSRGLVDRTEHTVDRRRMVLRLTDQGAKLVAGRRKEREQQLYRWLAPLSESELRGLQRGLTLLHDATQAELNRTTASASLKRAQ